MFLKFLRGVGCILSIRNHTAMLGKKCFSNAVYGGVRKFRAFVQEIVILLKGVKLVGWLLKRKCMYSSVKLVKVELADMHLVYNAADCRGPGV